MEYYHQKDMVIVITKTVYLIQFSLDAAGKACHARVCAAHDMIVFTEMVLNDKGAPTCAMWNAEVINETKLKLSCGPNPERCENSECSSCDWEQLKQE
eukprot:54213-Amphidinium_carterae.2